MANMVPSITHVQECRAGNEIFTHGRDVKRRKISSPEVSCEALGDADEIPRHPLDIKPLGNAYTASRNIKSASGNFKLLPDDFILPILEYLDAPSLVTLGSTCKALYAFTRADELWKALFLASPPKKWSWRGSWRSTFLHLPPPSLSRISCEGLYSDALYRPFHCSRLPIHPYTTNIPPRNEIIRLPNLTHEEFDAEWADKPFILTEPVKHWPIYSSWSMDSFLDKHKDTSFRAEAVDWPLRDYVDYMHDCSSDESPLYLFDRSFVEKTDLIVSAHPTPEAAYWPPTCFGDDLFAVLGKARPDSRWLIVGPARSGSTFHVDPNGTSAWNAVLSGAKYWIMFPPPREPSSSNPTGQHAPPGVFVSPDGSEVTSPLSIAEWLLGFHAEARRTKGCVEGICGAGEVLHVPSGWFHLVLNLEPSIAITQNFIPRAHLSSAMAFLRDKPDQVSGFRADVTDPYQEFVSCLRSQNPDVLDEVLQAWEKKDNGNDGNVARKATWEELVKPGEDTLFSFGWTGDDFDDDED